VSRLTLWLLFSLVGVQPLRAQTVAGPAPALDSSRMVLRDALLGFRDSLLTIDAAGARLQRDYRQASGPALLVRARNMRDACGRSLRTVAPTRSVVLGAELSGTQKLQQRRSLIDAIDRLKPALRKCETEFAAMSRLDQAETVRGYGNDRAQRVQSAVRRYEQTLYQFLQAMGIRALPSGVRQVPASR
jgi:hypothetical protein